MCNAWESQGIFQELQPGVTSNFRQQCHLSDFPGCIHLTQTSLGPYLFFYTFFFLAALGFCCCALAFSSFGEWGLLLVAVRGLLIAVASRCGARVLGVRASVVVDRGL